MSVKDVAIKYYNYRVFVSVDMNTLVGTILGIYKSKVPVVIEEMDDCEKIESEDNSGPIKLINDRFRIIERHEGGQEKRRLDLEEAAIASGQK